MMPSKNSNFETHTILQPSECGCSGVGYCNICDGGLVFCTVCHGGERELYDYSCVEFCQVNNVNRPPAVQSTIAPTDTEATPF